MCIKNNSCSYYILVYFLVFYKLPLVIFCFFFFSWRLSLEFFLRCASPWQRLCCMRVVGIPGIYDWFLLLYIKLVWGEGARGCVSRGVGVSTAPRSHTMGAGAKSGTDCAAHSPSGKIARLLLKNRCLRMYILRMVSYTEFAVEVGRRAECYSEATHVGRRESCAVRFCLLSASLPRCHCDSLTSTRYYNVQARDSEATSPCWSWSGLPYGIIYQYLKWYWQDTGKILAVFFIW